MNIIWPEAMRRVFVVLSHARTRQEVVSLITPVAEPDRDHVIYQQLFPSQRIQGGPKN